MFKQLDGSTGYPLLVAVIVIIRAGLAVARALGQQVVDSSECRVRAGHHRFVMIAMPHHAVVSGGERRSYRRASQRASNP